MNIRTNICAVQHGVITELYDFKAGATNVCLSGSRVDIEKPDLCMLPLIPL